MTTGVPGTNARQDPRQVSNTLKKVVNWNDAASGVAVPFDNPLPRGAFITDVKIEVVTAFNGTTPSVVAGTVGAGYNNIVAAGDVNEALAGVYEATRGLGRALTAAADVLPYVIYSNGGGGPSAGQLIIVITYEGGWAS